MSKLTVFLADDHAVVREGLKRLIEGQDTMSVVGEAGDGCTTCHEVAKLQPDITIMDVSMPLLNGIESTRRLKQLCPNTKVLVLTMHEEISYLDELMAAGASGYALKKTAGEELLHAISTVASGGTYIDPAMAGKLLSKQKQVAELPQTKWTTDLSDREEAVARLIAEGYSNKEIASMLHVSVKSVETYKARSMAKLGFRGRTDFVRYALDKGWLRPCDAV